MDKTLMTDEFLSDVTNVSAALTRVELLCQLAEEAAELAQAALKLARVATANKPYLNGQRVEPLSDGVNELYANIIEEYCDVVVAALAAGIALDKDLMHAKARRWAVRVFEGGEV